MIGDRKPRVKYEQDDAKKPSAGKLRIRRVVTSKIIRLPSLAELQYHRIVTAKLVKEGHIGEGTPGRIL